MNELIDGVLIADGTINYMPTIGDPAESTDLDELNGDWMTCYAVLVTPELITIDGTCRDQIRVLKCEAGHLHLSEQVRWEGPIAPIGFAEVWERKANFTGEPLARLQTEIKTLPKGEVLIMGPGRLT